MRVRERCLAGVRAGGRVEGRAGYGWAGRYMGTGRVEGQGFGVDGVKALSTDRAELGTGGLR